jgi:rod shape determining protein RodA
MLNTKIVSILKKYDLSFLIFILSIFLIGIMNLYSSTHADSDAHIKGLYKTQIFWFVISVIAGFLVSFIKPKTYFRYSYFIYFSNVVLLILVLIMGRKVLGAQRWLSIGPMRLQPSEMMKVSLVLALSRWFASSSPEEELTFKDLIVPLVLTLIPAVLIIVQPDLGTGLLLLLIMSVLIFYRRLRWRTIGIITVICVILSGFMYKFGLKTYQRQRILTFLDPWNDARGSGYNAIQSEIAIGSGQLFGKGFKKSSQAFLSYLPENHTDFIFAVFNEEHGFFGSLILVGLYITLLLRFIWLSSNLLNFYDSLMIIGLMSIFFWHSFINMSMVTGLLPIVGIPLPLVSYGGSNLLTFGICCGMATSISNSRKIF